MAHSLTAKFAVTWRQKRATETSSLLRCGSKMRTQKTNEPYKRMPVKAQPGCTKRAISWRQRAQWLVDALCSEQLQRAGCSVLLRCVVRRLASSGSADGAQTSGKQAASRALCGEDELKRASTVRSGVAPRRRGEEQDKDGRMFQATQAGGRTGQRRSARQELRDPEVEGDQGECIGQRQYLPQRARGVWKRGRAVTAADGLSLRWWWWWWWWWWRENRPDQVRCAKHWKLGPVRLSRRPRASQAERRIRVSQ